MGTGPAGIPEETLLFNAIDYPVQILLFPEGGDITTRTKKISDDYARDHGLPCYNYCLHPRTTGFCYIMNALRDGGLDAVYDVTIAYPDALPKTELDAWKGFLPREVHFHVKSYDDNDIPEEREELKAWLNARWLEKEARLEDFYTHQEFQERVTDNGMHTANGTAEHSNVSPEVFRPHDIPFLLYSIFIFVSTNLVLILPTLYIPYFWVYMVVSVVFLILRGRNELSEFIMRPKQGEVEKAMKKSKYNEMIHAAF